MKISKVSINRYRSIMKLNLDIDNNLMTIVGANNVGKTNFLRALDLFFSNSDEKFNEEIDIPYNIAKGSRGQGDSVKIEVTFTDDENGKIYTITKQYKFIKR